MNSIIKIKMQKACVRVGGGAYGMDKESSRDKENDHPGDRDTCSMASGAARRPCRVESNVSVRWRHEDHQKIIMGYFLHHSFLPRV